MATLLILQLFSNTEKLKKINLNLNHLFKCTFSAITNNRLLQRAELEQGKITTSYQRGKSICYTTISNND